MHLVFFFSTSHYCDVLFLRFLSFWCFFFAYYSFTLCRWYTTSWPIGLFIHHTKSLKHFNFFCLCSINKFIFGNGSNRQEESNLLEDCFTRRDIFERRHICTEVNFCTRVKKLKKKYKKARK